MFIRCSPYGISLLPHGNNLSIQTQTSTVLQQLYRLTCVSRQLQLRTGGFCWCKVYCPHAPAAGNQCIPIREKMLAFSTTVLSTLSPYHIHCLHTIHTYKFNTNPNRMVILHANLSCLVAFIILSEAPATSNYTYSHILRLSKHKHWQCHHTEAQKLCNA